MTTFFSSDHHFGHRNIARLAGRPFPDTDEGVALMNDALVQGWNECVGPDDVVMVLGDFAMGKISESLPVLERLNGTKHLIAGNHDRCWSGYLGYDDAKVQQWRGHYLAVGFASVVESATWQTDPIAAATPNREGVTLHHFPYSGDSHADDRHTDRRPVDDGGWLIHGHVHEAWRQRGRQINVGVDAWAGRPVPETTIAEMIVAGPRDLGPLDWVR